MSPKAPKESPDDEYAKVESAALSELEKRGILPKGAGYSVVYLAGGILEIVQNGAAKGFVKSENGKISLDFGLWYYRKSRIFNEAAYLAGYREIPSGNGRGMYYVSQLDPATWKPLPHAEPIEEKSMEYYRAWTDIDFYHSILLIEIMKGKNSDGTLTPVDELAVEEWTSSRALRISDVETYYAQKQMTKAQFDAAVAKIVPQINLQIGDERIFALGKRVTSAELDSYLKKGYLNADLHKRLKEFLAAFEASDKAMANRKQGVSEETKRKLRDMLAK